MPRRPEQTLIDILRMNYSSGDLNFIREIKLNEITEKIIRDLLRVDPSHRANSFIIRNGPGSGLQAAPNRWDNLALNRSMDP